jgi:sporulation protein YlmC with PRC-barrel domain
MSAVRKGEPPVRQDTHNLIQSDRVEGTAVYRSNGDKIGSIERLMLEKATGRVSYAVMSFGGFLGLGHDHYPIPWERLTYNEKLGGYEVNISDAELENAPKYSDQDKWDWSGERGREVYSYYGVPPYWGV